MKKTDTQNTCMACACPCEVHKDHTHDVHAEAGKKEEKGVCMACSCPCDEHKEHTHK